MPSQVLEVSLRLVFCSLLAYPCECGNSKGLGCVRGTVEAELPMRGSCSSGRERLSALRWAALRELLPGKHVAATGESRQVGSDFPARVPARGDERMGGPQPLPLRGPAAHPEHCVGTFVWLRCLKH